MTVTDEMVERAWAAVVGADVAGMCFQASIIRADLRTALEAVSAPAQAPPGNDEIKLTYIKRWRTIVKLPAKYADEIAEALRDPALVPSTDRAPAPSAWQPDALLQKWAGWKTRALAAESRLEYMERKHGKIDWGALLPSSDRGGVGVHRTTESADAPIGQQKLEDAAPSNEGHGVGT
jgi:hypothetical protein